MIIERGETLLKRNVGHVKRFIDPEPGVSQSKQGLAQPSEQTPVMEPAVFTNPKPAVSTTQRPATEPADDLLLTQACHSLLIIECPNRILNLEGPVERELSLVGLKTMSPERLNETDSLRIIN